MGEDVKTNPATPQTEHKSHFKEYMIIFVALAILTVLEVAIPFLEETANWIKATGLILLAIGKAFLVAYFYMHLNEETRWLKFIAAIPIVAAVYATVLILESMFR